jgi:putative tricarboxylic transport membrane protein
MEQWFLDIGSGILNVFHLSVFIASLIGVIAGIIIGVLPGLGPPIAISLAIPMTYGLEPIVAMSVLIGLYKGGTYGGSISAILINTPGTPAASASVLDGYKMAQQGKAGKALDIALYASVFGDAVSIMLLCVIAQPIASFAARFGPIELFSLLLFAMTIIAGLAGQSIVKGLIAATLGLAFSLIGMDPIAGLPRFSFGSLYLESGLNVIAMIVGLFAISEQMGQVNATDDNERRALNVGQSKNKTDNYATIADIKRCLPSFLRGSAIGASIGALPGTGAAVAAFISYGVAKKRSKHPEEFGNGSIEGVAAPEAGNNAVCGGALIPMLTLGIPGDVVTAVMMGALMLHGIQSGPAIFTENRVFVFTLFGMLIVSIFMLLFSGMLMVKICRKLAEISNSYISPIVVLLCVAGTYAVNYSISDVWTMLFFGIFGFIFLKLDIPIPPFIIAFILAPTMEQSLRQGLLISGGNFSVLVTHPLSLLFLCLTCLALIKIVYDSKKQNVDNLTPS